MKRSNNLILKIIAFLCVLALGATIVQVFFILNPAEDLSKPKIEKLDPSINFELVNQVYENRYLKLDTYTEK